MATNEKEARRAARVAREKALSGTPLADELGMTGVGRGEDANHLANLGRDYERRDASRLTPAELLLLRTAAVMEREQTARGATSSLKMRWIGRRAGKSEGWAAATARKRLGTHRAGEDETRRTGSGLNLFTARRNGHGWLTEGGWALVQAVEAAELAEPSERELEAAARAIMEVAGFQLDIPGRLLDFARTGGPGGTRHPRAGRWEQDARAVLTAAREARKGLIG